MSRLEEILERATKLRDGGVTPLPPTSNKTESFPDESSYRVEKPLKIENHFLVPIADPHSPVAEEYRKLKSKIVKLSKEDGFKNVIMVTSTVPGEGKSLTSLNLALSLAQEYDHTVLLVDADLRRPSIARYLGISQEKGLTDCLMKGVQIPEVLIKTGIGKLAVLPSGSAVADPVELLSSARMQEFISELKNRYPDRYVIIDTPPVLSFAETYAIASAVDGVLFVIQERAAPLKNIQDALATLKHVNLFGIVYNNVEFSRFDENYRYYDHRHYYRVK